MSNKMKMCHEVIDVFKFPTSISLEIIANIAVFIYFQ